MFMDVHDRAGLDELREKMKGRYHIVEIDSSD
jgi:hypothetical protein